MQLLRNLVIDEINKKERLPLPSLCKWRCIIRNMAIIIQIESGLGDLVTTIQALPSTDFRGTYCKTTGRDVADYGKRAIHHRRDGRK